VLRNTPSAYGSVAKFLHWLMALWFVAAYAIIIYLKWNNTKFPIPGLNYHKVVGFSILLPYTLRLLWRLANPPPQLPAAVPRWQARVSHVSHGLLYLIMLVMPVTGYLGNGGGVDYGVFQIPSFMRSQPAARLFEVLGITMQQWDVFFDTIHYGFTGPYLFPTLIALHVGAGLYHHFVQKDDVLRRMLPGRRAP
jgi:cytochrome b561